MSAEASLYFEKSSEFANIDVFAPDIVYEELDFIELEPLNQRLVQNGFDSCTFCLNMGSFVTMFVLMIVTHFWQTFRYRRAMRRLRDPKYRQ